MGRPSRPACALVAAALFLLAQGCRRPPPVPEPLTGEPALRAKLGIPADAARVLVLSQSSHLDVDWVRTFDEYYQGQVRDIFDRAQAWLDAEPGAVYSIAEVAFLERYVAERGAEALRPHVESGRLRLVGGGLTSPDTVLPTEEALLHDFLAGSLFAELTFSVRPRTAWVPDDFGHSPTAPDLLAAMGLTAVGMARVDGVREVSEVDHGAAPTAPGSTAEALTLLGSADFVWEGPGGASVLAHWMPTSDQYGQGDAIDLYGLAGDEPGYTNQQLDTFIAQLTPFARTPYLFVPVGSDFASPTTRLVEYAKRWNDGRYSRTGVWVAIATFEDYMDLVGFHREELPRLSADVNPYWTGYYGAKPALKRAAREAGDALTGVEPFLWAGDPSGASWRSQLDSAWHSVALSDHHDFITGTSVDAVVSGEQLPMLAEAATTASALWAQASAALATRAGTAGLPPGDPVVVFNPGPRARSAVVEVDLPGSGPVGASSGTDALPAQRLDASRVAFLAGDVPAFGWRAFSVGSTESPGATASLAADVAELHTGHLDASIERSAAGTWALSSLFVDGTELLAAPGLEWVNYLDDGGLYRIGTEFIGYNGRFSLDRVSRATSVELLEAGPARVTFRLTANGRAGPLVLDLSAEAGARRLGVRASGAAAEGDTTTLRLFPAAAGAQLRMGVAGGVVERPLSHLYEPTFWPATRWVQRGRVAVLLGASTGVHGSADGALEWMAFRNAVQEQWEDLGAGGHDAGRHELVFALGADATLDLAAQSADALELGRPLLAAVTDRHPGTLPASGALVAVDGAGVVPLSLGAAQRGEGLVLRLLKPGPGAATVTVRTGLVPFTGLSRPDYLERDDVPFGDGATGGIEQALTALRLTGATAP